MSEQYNFLIGAKGNTFFNHLLLQSEVRHLTKREDFDSSDLKVELKINGETVKIQDFNEILEDWGNRIESQIKDKLDYLSKEKSVVENAELLLKEKLGKAYELLQDIENNMWLLSE